MIPPFPYSYFSLIFFHEQTADTWYDSIMHVYNLIRQRYHEYLVSIYYEIEETKFNFAIYKHISMSFW